MKKLFLLLTAGVMSAVGVSAQTVPNEVIIRDTRSVDDLPGASPQRVRFDFKYRETLGVPGSNYYSANMTLAPWSDASGGKVHQLNFNEGGMFHRTGNFGGGWDSWAQVLTSKGNHILNGKLLIKTSIDNILSLENPDPNGWSYMEFLSSTGRKAYMGISTNNNLQITKEGGGNICLTGANVGIGVFNPNYTLTVGGVIGARKVKISQETWSDFVFDADYKLPTLYEMEQFIREHKHLPDIPAESEVKKEGLDLGDINKRLLQKLEEFSLYLIQHQKELDALKAENAALKKEIGKLK